MSKCKDIRTSLKIVLLTLNFFTLSCTSLCKLPPGNVSLLKLYHTSPRNVLTSMCSFIQIKRSGPRHEVSARKSRLAARQFKNPEQHQSVRVGHACHKCDKDRSVNRSDGVSGSSRESQCFLSIRSLLLLCPSTRQIHDDHYFHCICTFARA